MFLQKTRLAIGVVCSVCLAGSITAWSLEREPLEQYQNRRAALWQELDDGLLVLFGKDEPPGAEAYHRFWQESNFYYLTGYAKPGAALLLAPARKPAGRDQPRDRHQEILFLPERKPQQEHWKGPRLDPKDPATSLRTGFPIVQPMETLESEIRRYGRRYSVVYTLLADPHSSEMRQALYRQRTERIRALLPSAEIRDARKALARLRQVKSASELRLIRRAVDCTIEAQMEALRAAQPRQFEYELAALIKYTMERNGCERPSFAPIVASGRHATILHYNEATGQMQDGDLVVLDVGAEYAHYAADISRTLPVNGRFTPRQREIYEIVLGAQKAAIAAVKPGVKLYGRGSESLHRIAYDYINSHGRDQKGEPLGKYFTHGLSHHVGLDVHDPADRRAALQPGMVITIEPGLYLPEENIGVRIEDMVLVTNDGYEVLTDRLPREVQAIEDWMEE